MLARGSSRFVRVEASRSSSRGSASSKGTYDSEASVSGTNTDHIRVIVRCRPLVPKEVTNGDKLACEPEGKDSLRLTGQGPVNSDGSRVGDKSFRFNRVFMGESTQREFFEGSGVKNLLDSALNGYAATVFAYGQTGSGKTYSMSGFEEQIIASGTHQSESDGLIPRSIRYVFERIQQEQARSELCSYKIMSSFCEIYNEQVYDLLNTTHQCLQVRWNPGKGFFVEDLLVAECESLQDVLDVLAEGHRNRRVGSHELNKDSSRSHSMMTMHVQSETVDPDDGHKVVKFGKIVFVDLAGSERLKDSKSAGVALAETGAINKSLFTLANVISSLSNLQKEATHGKSSPNQSPTHIPYRDSKLTKLLMDSLGGTSLTLMICCCSPSSSYIEETLNTLKYATRAAQIKNKPTLQLDSKEQLIARLREEIKLLRMENDFLREQCGEPPRESGGNLSMRRLSESSHSSARQQVVSPRGVGNGSSSNLPLIGQHQGLVPPGLGLAAMSPKVPADNFSRSGPRSPKANSISLSSDQQQLAPPVQQQQQQQEQQNGSLHSAPSIEKVLSGYQKEINRLKSENRDIRTREVMSERSFHNAMIENESLQRKLEHLEEIFVLDDGDNKQGEAKRSGALSADAAQAQQLKSENRRLHQQLQQANNLRIENQQLSRLVETLRQREVALLARLGGVAQQPQFQQFQEHQQRNYLEHQDRQPESSQQYFLKPSPLAGYPSHVEGAMMPPGFFSPTASLRAKVEEARGSYDDFRDMYEEKVGFPTGDGYVFDE